MPLPDPEKGITGFCPCCGEPDQYDHITHSRECVWYDDRFYSAEEIAVFRQQLKRANEEARQMWVDRGITVDRRVAEWKKNREI